MIDLNYLVVYNSHLYQVRNVSHQEVYSSFMSMSWANHQLITIRYHCKVKGRNTMTVHHGTQSFLMMAIQVAHKQKRGSHILCLDGSH